MKNKIIVMILAVVLVLGMASCGKSENEYIADESKIINTVESGFGYAIFIDVETGVMYVEVADGGTCVMVNPDGTPKIWSK